MVEYTGSGLVENTNNDVVGTTSRPLKMLGIIGWKKHGKIVIELRKP